MSNRSYVNLYSGIGKALIATFNSPWECRIGLTVDLIWVEEPTEISFQFPVGMSNRSYDTGEWDFSWARDVNFQFPVGMSNRSYV